MSLMHRKIDKLNVFHPTTGKHAGTLQLTATYQQDDRGNWRRSGIAWTWQGGALGPQNGDALWKTDNGAYFLLESTGVPQQSMILRNSRWIHAEEYRPWFQPADQITLRDWNFGAPRKDPFVWECKVNIAAS
jgi:hypothetical protein